MPVPHRIAMDVIKLLEKLTSSILAILAPSTDSNIMQMRSKHPLNKLKTTKSRKWARED